MDGTITLPMHTVDILSISFLRLHLSRQDNRHDNQRSSLRVSLRDRPRSRLQNLQLNLPIYLRNIHHINLRLNLL